MRSHRYLLSLALLAALVPACQKGVQDKDKNKPADAAVAERLPDAAAGKPAPRPDAGPPPVAPLDPIESKDILDRAQAADEVAFKHVLIGWKELAAVYRGKMDPRAAKRTQEEAATLAGTVATKLRAAPDTIDALAKEYSEDPSSATGVPYTVSADSGMVAPLKQLALRLKLDEVGIVRTPFGYHVMIRVTPPPLDPLESADILARKSRGGTVQVQHVLIGWKDVPASKQRPGDPRAAKRSKAEADKLAVKVLEEVRAGGDMAAIMKKYSEDPGSKDDARAYDVSADAPLVEPFKKLALRLEDGEAGLVKSDFGWHIMKRVPPDNLVSADILARDPVTQKAKVKHILLGWTAVHADDPRGAKRTRAELEALVTKTLAALNKGDKIEPLMKELSEDPGSAATGESYDVTPDAGLVPPFKDLSLRLKVGEAGAVLTQFGIHIIQRVE
jgi:parvulin-like peptidyl-prolyl isomerase